MTYFFSFVIALILTIALMPVLVRVALHLNILDVPDNRKVHSIPIPRIGGLAMAIGAVIPITMGQNPSGLTGAYLAGASVLVATGLVDDWKGLGYRVKFAGQIAAALIFIFWGGIKITSIGSLMPDDFICPHWISIPLTIVAIVGVTNAINLADGLDGLAGGICFLSLACIAYLAYQVDNVSVLLISSALAGAVFGFLRFNTHPAKLFMGDTGSQFLGFSVIVLSLSLTQGNTPFSPLLPLIILGFPVLDTLSVMLERIYKGLSMFEPDKKHFHHKLLKIGLYHSEAVFTIYVIQALLIVAALIFKYESEWLLLLGYLVIAGLIMAGFFTADKMDWRLKRYSVIDKVIKGRLKTYKEKGYLIIASFKIIEIGLPLLLFLSCLFLNNLHIYYPLVTAVVFAGLFLILIFKKNWLRWSLSIALYIFIPIVIFIGAFYKPSWFNETIEFIYDLSCLVMMFFVIMTLKFTGRTKGFKATPLDFLIIFMALATPVILEPYIGEAELTAVTVRAIIFLFSFEVLIGELRDKLNRLTMMTLAIMAVFIVQGLL